MGNVRSLWLCIILASLLGCTELTAGEIYADGGLPVTAEKHGEEIRFHILGTDGQAIISGGISVCSVRGDGTRGQCYWRVSADPNIPLGKRSPILLPIIFGQDFPGMLTRISAIPLIPGEYVISGIITPMNMQEAYELRMSGRFFVLGDGGIELPKD